MIRIGSGQFKGKIIKIPQTRLTRVTTSYSRKVIFDTMMSSLEGAVILDLFAGSGSLGIESLSRGAKFVYFIDHEEKPAATLKTNIASLFLESRCKIIKQDAFTYLGFLKNTLFNIIFLDPPYTISFEKIYLLIQIICDQKLLLENGIICLELTTKYSKKLIETLPSTLYLHKEKKRGDTTLLFMKLLDPVNL